MWIKVIKYQYIWNLGTSSGKIIFTFEGNSKETLDAKSPEEFIAITMIFENEPVWYNSQTQDLTTDEELIKQD